MSWRLGLVVLLGACVSGCVEVSNILGPESGSSPVFSFEHSGNGNENYNAVPSSNDNNEDEGDNSNENANLNDNTGEANQNGNVNAGENSNANASDTDSVIFGGVGDIPLLEGYEVVTTDSGLKYIDVEVGTGEQPPPGARVTVNYTGWLTDGTEFDGQDGIQFGLNAVIAGWTEGVGTMRVGGQRRLLIPPELGYGAAGQPPKIPPEATLVFDVDLLEFEE